MLCSAPCAGNTYRNMTTYNNTSESTSKKCWMRETATNPKPTRLRRISFRANSPHRHRRHHRSSTAMATPEDMTGVDDEEGVEVDAMFSQHGSKRPFHKTGTVGLTSGGQPAKLSEAMGKLPVQIGEADYKQPLLMGVLQAITETARDLNDLKMTVVKSYEGPVQWSYPAAAKKCQQTYAEYGKEVKGSRINLGPAKNYCFAGLIIAMLEDNQVAAQDKTDAKTILRNRIFEKTAAAGGGQKEKLVLKESKKLADLVSYCSVNQGKKQSYINIAYTEHPEAKKMEEIMTRAFLNTGWRQWDTAPLKPIHRELRDTMRAARKGAGKGSR